MLTGFVILSVILFFTIFAGYVDRYDPLKLEPLDRLLAPSLEHWFGTDNTGRDVYSRTIHGGRVSLLVGFSVAILTVCAGMVIGLISGYDRRADIVIQRFMDAIMSFPTLLLALALIAMLGSSITNVIIVITVVDTPRMVRIVRAQVLALREFQFVEAARSIGAPTWRILLLHVAPNTFAPVMVQATFVFATAILVEAGLSFLGLGIPPDLPSWGNILALGRTYLQTAVWVSFFPGLILTISVLAINLVGDGLRDALDPKLARRE
ncbi:MAG: ABC transporter permease [Dehalococcoidia bacterium]|nr:ABC transporter permease [Dehalococcoidia bacterium]MYA61800.1 ABC transporter permease [Dehalococcoidia bacterium]